MEDSTRKKIVSLIIGLLIVLVGVGITFAFFVPNVNNDNSLTIDVTTSKNAKITFNNGADLVLDATEPGTTSTAYFNVQINSTGDSLTGVYDIYFVISNNTFIHDNTLGHTSDKEITYSLYSSSDNATWTPMITDVDITGITGDVRIAANELITAQNSLSTIKYYKFTVNYPSLQKDQSFNMQKSISGYIEIRSSM